MRREGLYAGEDGALARKVNRLQSSTHKKLRGVPLEAFSTVYSSCAALAGYEGDM